MKTATLKFERINAPGIARNAVATLLSGISAAGATVTFDIESRFNKDVYTNLTVVGDAGLVIRVHQTLTKAAL